MSSSDNSRFRYKNGAEEGEGLWIVMDRVLLIIHDLLIVFNKAGTCESLIGLLVP